MVASRCLQWSCYAILFRAALGALPTASFGQTTMRTEAKIDKSESLTQVQQRMMYWKGADSPAPARLPALGDRYLFFDYDHGGLNNLRIGWEMAAIAAVESNRTLVYPPRETVYIVNAEPSGLDYYVNMDRLHAGLSVLSLHEFFQQNKQLQDKMPTSLLQWSNGPADADFRRASHDWRAFQHKFMISVGSRDEEVCDISRYRQPAKMLFHDVQQGSRIFTCGNWPNVGEPRFNKQKNAGLWQTPDWAFALLRNHFVWHPDAFDIAARVVEHLGLFSYVSMHARYGDFQFQNHKSPRDTLLKDGWLSMPDGPVSLLETGHSSQRSFLQSQLGETSEGMTTAAAAAARARQRGQRLVSFVRTWLQGNEQRHIYIATDERSDHFLEPFREANLHVVRFKELMEDAHAGRGPLAAAVKSYSPQRLSNLAGVVEQLICTFGRVFIGSEKSTFSGYIERMRLYAQAPTHATYIKYAGVDASDKGLRLFHDDPINPAVQKQVEEQINQWESNGGKLDREDLGVLPRDAA